VITKQVEVRDGKLSLSSHDNASRPKSTRINYVTFKKVQDASPK
jgi:hypothetical protein